MRLRRTADCHPAEDISGSANCPLQAVLDANGIALVEQVQPITTRSETTSSFLVSCGGVRLSPFGTSATDWPIVPAPVDRR
jgi:hypothetical protein